MNGVGFTVKGERLHLTDRAVVEAVRGVEPEAVHKHGVEIAGVVFPVKQAFALATGLDLLDFNTNQARDVLKRLGFRVVRSG
jgi:hypothetical protein